jgi:SAM-dependent methyltransferase
LFARNPLITLHPQDLPLPREKGAGFVDELRNDPVAVQYEQWSYPEPWPDLTQVPFQSPDYHFKELQELYWAYWPCAPYREDLDILVAGCGTVAAASYSYLFPRARVLGIDISAASLAHEEVLKKKHNLNNLTLRQCRVEDAGMLGLDFDFIATHGVLHHLAEPVSGLRALGGVLRQEGVIAVMVYGRYGRAGVYMLQELFRLLGLEQNPQSLQVVKDALTALHPEHPVQRYLRLASDLHSAPGLVDTFLHQRDRPYTVGECLDLVHEAGLTFQGWDENSYYYPDGQIPASHPFYAAINKLEGRALWQAMELFYGCLPGHFFHVCRSDRPEARYRICFEGDAFLDYIPVPRVTQRVRAEPLQGRPATIARPPFAAVGLDNWQALVFNQIDSQRTVRACLRDAGLAVQSDAIVEFARGLFRSLWRVGYMVFRMPASNLA